MNTTRAAAFRELHRPGEPLLLPNAWDFASAAALARAGFAAVGTTSLGVAAAVGVPDAHGRAREATLALARRIAALPCPVTVDTEAGFSEDPGAVGALAAELRDLGIAGINVEDGRPDGRLAAPDHQARLVRAAKDQAPELFVNARVDTFWCAGDTAPSLEETLTRARTYVDAGADGVFVPGRLGEREIAAVTDAVPAPVNVLYLRNLHSVSRLAELGARRISTGSLLFRTALHGAVAAAREIRGDREAAGEPPSYGEVQEMLT